MSSKSDLEKRIHGMLSEIGLAELRSRPAMKYVRMLLGSRVGNSQDAESLPTLFQSNPDVTEAKRQYKLEEQKEEPDYERVEIEPLTEAEKKGAKYHWTILRVNRKGDDGCTQAQEFLQALFPDGAIDLPTLESFVENETKRIEALKGANPESGVEPTLTQKDIAELKAQFEMLDKTPPRKTYHPKGTIDKAKLKMLGTNLALNIAHLLHQHEDFSLTDEDIVEFYPHVLYEIGPDRHELTIPIASAICARYALNGYVPRDPKDTKFLKQRKEFVDRVIGSGVMPETADVIEYDDSYNKRTITIGLGNDTQFLRSLLSNLDVVGDSLENIKTFLKDITDESHEQLALRDYAMLRRGLTQSVTLDPGDTIENYLEKLKFEKLDEQILAQGGISQIKDMRLIIDLLNSSYRDFYEGLKTVQLPTLRAFLDTIEEKDYMSGGHNLSNLLAEAGFGTPEYRLENKKTIRGNSLRIGTHGVLTEKYVHPENGAIFTRKREYTTRGDNWAERELDIESEELELEYRKDKITITYTPIDGADKAPTVKLATAEQNQKYAGLVEKVNGAFKAAGAGPKGMPGYLALERAIEGTLAAEERTNEAWLDAAEKNMADEGLAEILGAAEPAVNVPKTAKIKTWTTQAVLSAYNRFLNPQTNY